MKKLTEIDMQNIRLALTVEVRQANERGHYASAYQSMLTYNKCCSSTDMPYTDVDLEGMKGMIK